MKQPKNISSKERTLLAIFAFFAFSFFAVFTTADVISSHNYAIANEQEDLAAEASLQPRISFSVDSVVPVSAALFNFLLLPIFFALLRTRKFIVSTVLTVLYCAFFVLSMILKVDGRGLLGGSYPPDVGVFEELYRKTYFFDYATAVFVVVLLVWQFTILLRISKRTYSSKGFALK